MKTINQPLVTIAIPTYNRSKYLGIAIESCLSQTYQNIEILIVDNASSDNTKDIVKSYKDKRITYKRNKKNIGMMNNWNKSIDLAKGKYLLILGDDDKLHTDFVEETMRIYTMYPKLGFIFTHANKVDEHGNILMKWGYDFTPSGYLIGVDYLYYTIKYGCCLTNSSTMMCRKEIYNNVGLYEAEFAKNTFDFNMYIKIAGKYDVYFLSKVLTDYRIHPSQVSEIHWRLQTRPTGKIGTYLEIFKAIGILLSDKNFTNVAKIKTIKNRITDIDKNLSILLTRVIPEL